jgi:hypothetical protein
LEIESFDFDRKAVGSVRFNEEIELSGETESDIGTEGAVDN